jgi:DNA-binding PadR family transcriptional regulator
MFKDKELYGYDINKNLAIQGIEVDLSRLYGILNNMRKEDLLQDRWEKSSSGPRKKMYSVTEKGRERLTGILLEAIGTVHSFYSDYLVSLLPEINIFGDFFRLITEQMEGNENIAYLTTNFFNVHELILGFIQKKNPRGKTFVVKPRKLDVVTNITNLSILDGSYNDLPFKTDFIDRLIMIDLPVFDLLEESVTEWQRVISDNGRLIIITPTILIEKQIHPMTIGDFVEKHEHEVHEGGSHIERDVLFPILNKKFDDLQETSITHMSIITTDNTP